jgi:hypothetical protein
MTEDTEFALEEGKQMMERKKKKRHTDEDLLK